MSIRPIAKEMGKSGNSVRKRKSKLDLSGIEKNITS